MKSDTVSTVSPCICHEVMGLDAMILVFWILSFKPTFLLFSFSFIKRLFSSSSLSAIRVVSSAYLRLLIFLPPILVFYYQHNSWCFLSIHSIPNYFLGLFSDHYNRPLGWCYYCMPAKSLESCLTLWDPMDCGLPGSCFLISTGFSKQEYLRGLACPPPGDLPNPGINQYFLCLLYWQSGSLPLAPPRKPNIIISLV